MTTETKSKAQMATYGDIANAWIAKILILWQDLPAETTGKQRTFHFCIKQGFIWEQRYGNTGKGIKARYELAGFEGAVNEALTRARNEAKNLRPLGVRDGE